MKCVPPERLAGVQCVGRAPGPAVRERSRCRVRRSLSTLLARKEVERGHGAWPVEGVTGGRAATERGR